MSKKQTSPKRETKVLPPEAPQHDWMVPVSVTAPCGPDLEYDQDFVVLFSRAEAGQDVQYGDFVGVPEPVSWVEIDRDCRRLMMRCKDIRVAVLFARCRTHLMGAAGLAEGLALLAAWLEEFPDAIHPQIKADDDPEAVQQIRANALQALTDPDGLLADVREIVLAKSTLARLQVRDVERAFAIPHPADALAPDSVTLQLQDLYAGQPALMADLDNAAAKLKVINTWCAGHLETYQPDLSSLIRLFQLLRMQESLPETPALPKPEPVIDGADAVTKKVMATPDRADENGLRRAPESSRAKAAPADREAALAMIRMARQWFETHEPSSPIPVLLNRAEQFVGKRYAQAVRAIPADLLAQWEEEGKS